MNRMLVLGVAAVFALGVAAIAFAATGGESQEGLQARAEATPVATATATAATRVPATATSAPQTEDAASDVGESRDLIGGNGDGTPQDGQVPPVAPGYDFGEPAATMENGGEGGGSMPSSYDTEEKRREVPPSNWNGNGSSGAPDEPVSSDDPPLRPDYTPGGAPTPSEPPPYDVEVVMAPIDALDILSLDSFPPQYMLWIQAGLPSGCAGKHSHEVHRQGDVIRVEVLNTMPVGPVACTMIYGMYELNLNLGSDFESGRTYTVIVNDQEITFTAE